MKIYPSSHRSPKKDHIPEDSSIVLGQILRGERKVSNNDASPCLLAPIIPEIFENHPCLWLSEIPRPNTHSNKYTRGHALIYGGFPMTGAARMAAHAAARAGAGLTTIAVPEIAFPIYATALTSILVHPLMTSGDFDTLLGDDRYTAFLIGPGAGVGEDIRTRVLAMLETDRPTLLDAEALTAFRNDPQLLDRAIIGPCIMTPHDGEFELLFDPSGNKIFRARAAAHRSGAIIVLKGSNTVIASPDGRIIVNTNGPPSLATAGSGDVLSGIILGLLTQGMDPFLASAAGVWMHGAAAAEFGPGLIAEDLPDLLPGVLRQLYRT